MAGDPSREALSPDDLGALAGDLRRWLVRRPQSPAGAFYAWRDALTGEPAFEYPEVTGYALTHLAGQRPPLEVEVEAGRQAGGWLVRRVSAGDLSAHSGPAGGAVYNFDLAMVASGLLSFGSLVADEAMVTTGLGLAEELRDQIEADPRLPAVRRHRSAGSAAFPPVRRSWSSQGGAHLLKVVQCLVRADALGADGCGEAAASLVRTRGNLQREDGSFVTHEQDGVVLHPHLYAVEGLWMHGVATGDGIALGRARAATEWAWRQQLPSGGFPRWTPSAPGHGDDVLVEQTDVTSQVVRAALLVGERPAGFEAALARLAGIALQDGEDGSALPYQPSSGRPHMNTAATLFGAQALAMAVTSSPAVSWSDLV
ncbi:MAG: hypothetical protein ACRD0L_11295 [Acidimicrobiales bacterium]